MADKPKSSCGRELPSVEKRTAGRRFDAHCSLVPLKVEFEGRGLRHIDLRGYCPRHIVAGLVVSNVTAGCSARVTPLQSDCHRVATAPMTMLLQSTDRRTTR